MYNITTNDSGNISMSRFNEKGIQRIQFFLISLCIHLAALLAFGFIVMENTYQVRESVAVQMIKAPREVRKIRHNIIKAKNPATLDHQMPEMAQYNLQTLINPSNVDSQNISETIPMYQYEPLDAKSERISPKLALAKQIVSPLKPVVMKPKPYVSQESIFDLRQPFEKVLQKPSFDFHSPDDAESTLILRNFLDLVSQRIKKTKRYPALALDAGIEGRVVVRFTILKDGTLDQDLQMVKSSGTEILDNAALAAIKAAAPFPAIPPSLGRDKLRIELPMDFNLTES